MTELKLCPFCGGTANIAKGRIEFWTYCPHCGAQTELYETEQETIKAWNTRQIEGTKDEKIKHLREALNEIKKTVEDAQDTIYPFHIALDSKDAVYILDIAKEALKGDKE